MASSTLKERQKQVVEFFDSIVHNVNEAVADQSGYIERFNTLQEDIKTTKMEEMCHLSQSEFNEQYDRIYQAYTKACIKLMNYAHNNHRLLDHLHDNGLMGFL